jgi:DNA (cytosine-5)-methyltransferase 1
MAIVAVGLEGSGFVFRWQPADLPAPAIRARDRGGYAGSEIVLDDHRPPERSTVTGKPPYRVPSMKEIIEIPWNGYTVASTFSGCGGSSLGYRLAGYRVAYANEFVPAARDTYAANQASYTVLDPRDIRQISGESILAKIGMAAGELDLLDGSPPCASFSTSGKRQDGWGKVKKYSDTTQRTDDLFYEFCRVLTAVQPKTFVAENVSGLIKGTAKGYFIRIMKALRDCGYRVDAKLLDAQWLGVPQARQRLIFVGVREDLRRAPAYPRPLPYRYAVREVLSGIEQVTAKGHGYFDGGDMSLDRPSPTVVASPGGAAWYGHEVHTKVIAQGANPAYGAGEVAPVTRPSLTIGASPQTGNGRTPPSLVISEGPLTHDPETGKDLRIPAAEQYRKPGTVARKFTLGELRRICSFPDDFVFTGTYEQRWERMGRAVPPVMMQHIATAVRTKILNTL